VIEAVARSARKSRVIVECYSRHDEVYLTTVSLLKQLGYEVHIFNLWRNRTKNSFIYATGLEPRIRSRHSHSMVAGGLPEMSYTTREMPFTSLTMRREHTSRNSYGSRAQCAVMKSMVSTARRLTT